MNDPIVCPNCKAPIDPSWKVCQSCRRPVDKFIEQTMESNARQESRSELQALASYGAGGLALAGLVGLGCWALFKAAAPAEPEAPPVVVAPAASTAAATVAPIKPPDWRFVGRVYYLSDAKPAAGVDVAYETPNGKRWSASTDARGRYSVSVPSPNESYRVSLSNGGKPLAYIEDVPALPFRTRSAAQRRDVIEQARQSTLLHTPVTPDSLETVQDFALLP